ncbi:aggregation-promoting factor [Streptococcus ilei]|jgi:lysM domain protein|uniref:aggregation-promoting factor n=1 Tax=Streptococcus TaxID=1301 RepID=UPI0003B9359A|nr:MULTISPECIES: LysM peptidoglycan-binding domain-containing protein [Streptococcus]AGY40550.1 peptidoglycan-binding protein LysM [Streptococcus ilei]MTQ42453.1 LysM peptidoglycan-binding domain-containing protein [Streptococcus sp. BIOML-A1]RJU49917.1 LysM peptidoglycan-binding domain-containing protein [Streptococcus sp. AM28-20]RYS60153.1 LysM peptidoglycan-binding domain-containing protein [Streptococcus sp. bf_0095]
MNKKMFVKRVIELSLLSGMFIPVLASAESYTVKSGDTLSAIAKEKNTTVDEIAKKNKISNVNLITVGQVLEIEETSSTKQTTEQATTSKVDTTQATTTGSASNGLSAEDAAAKEWIAQKESSGSYTAQNGQYYGRYQLTITYLNGDLSPENQEKVANQYVVNRYGSWSAAKNFWLTNGWY